MAIDAGAITVVVPTQAATSATPETAGAITLSGAAVKGGFQVVEECDLFEVGIVVTTALTVSPIVVAIERATTTGTGATFAALTTSNGAAITLTSPVAAVAIGTQIIKRGFVAHLSKGDCVRFNVTTAPTAGAGYFYAKLVPTGESGSAAADQLLSST